MAFIDDLVTLVTPFLGSGTALAVSSKATLPTTGKVLELIETGGTAPERTHNSVIVPAYQRPTAQLVAHAPTTLGARTLARSAYNAVVGVRNTVVSGGVFYREINPLQEPFDLGLDGNGREQIAFNVMAIKRPS